MDQAKDRCFAVSAVLVAARGAPTHHRMEGGLQPATTTIVVGQHHAQRIRHENGA